MNISKDAIDLVKSMIKYDPKDRLSALECLKHPWIIKNELKNQNDEKMSKTSLANMRKFKAKGKLERATMSFIVNQLISKQERNELLSQFQGWDKNGDGVLSRDEIYDGYSKLYGELIAMEEVVFF
jgi:calcium-dependent protein kinase